ncbi:MAG: nucleoside-diphosphate sugar epimerase/dehydratase [Acidobacteriota bacterium]
MEQFSIRNRHFLILDLLLLSFTPALALGLRVDPAVYHSYTEALVLFTIATYFVKFPIFHVMDLYRRYWRYASVSDATSIALAVGIATVLDAGIHAAGQLMGFPPARALPRSVPLIDGLLTLVVVGGTRFALRAIALRQSAESGDRRRRRVLIAGAGNAGALVARDMLTGHHRDFEPVAFVDDDREKLGVRIHDLPVAGSLKQIPEVVERYAADEVIIAMPSAAGKTIRETVRACESAGVPCKTLPGIHQLVSGRAIATRLRSVNIEDLLRRETMNVDLGEVESMVRDRRVLVTGAGGSIGSELCRQITRFSPAQLTLLGHGENSLFMLSNELQHMKDLPSQRNSDRLLITVGDVRDRPRIETIFRRTQPQIVFHAAAHKHVPMMEDNVESAVTNNVVGTRNVAELSEAFEVERFVLISTDKAVNPSSAMGATKRVAEMIVAEVARRSSRPYVAVRFGNVLGSRGSVVPLFTQQIAAGGPVTVTHPEVRRYFMTIPEAVQLVLQAAAMSRNGEVYVLDMGEPMKIVDLARDMIELSGLSVERDIDIVYSGLRPGEKLFEDLFLDQEEFQRTRHSQILQCRNGKALPEHIGTPAALFQHVEALHDAARRGEPDEVRRLLRTIVPEYTPAGETEDGRRKTGEEKREMEDAGKRRTGESENR